MNETAVAGGGKLPFRRRKLPREAPPSEGSSDTALHLSSGTNEEPMTSLFQVYDSVRHFAVSLGTAGVYHTQDSAENVSVATVS